MCIKEDWDKLDKDHKEFVIRVRNNGENKYGAEPIYIDSNVRCYPPNDEYFKHIALWKIAEESGFIECIGSYKWTVTDKFRRLEGFLFGI